MGRIGIVLEVSEEFFPLCLTRLRKLADLGACFKVLSAVVLEVVSSLIGSAELWRWPWFGVSADFGFTDACFGSRN